MRPCRVKILRAARSMLSSTFFEFFIRALCNLLTKVSNKIVNKFICFLHSYFFELSAAQIVITNMRKLISAICLAGALFCACGCSTYVSSESYAMASQGETVMEYGGFGTDKNMLRNATLLALQQRGWTVTDTNNPIQARIDEIRQHPRLSIDVQSGDKIVIDTKGSLVDGDKAYVPVRYLGYLMESIRKNVLIGEAGKVK